MKRWLNWLINGSYPYKKRWWLVGGRFILSLWITIIALCGIVIAGIYVVDPASFSDPKPDTECQTVEYNGEVIDTCEYLYP